MKIKFYLMIGVLIIILFGSCMTLITARPKKVHFAQRLQVFPISQLPLKDSAVIYWDNHLIPFIDARNDADCAFLLGMVHAHLRLAQMTLLRRVVEGRLAESAGPLATDIDHAIRIINLGGNADSIIQVLPEETRDWLQNYVNGINFYQEQMGDRPSELALLGIDIEPWALVDVIKLGRLASADVNWFNWFQWLKFREKPYWPEIWQRFLDQGFQSTPSFRPELSFIPSAIKSGSNAMVISAERSADGHAILATDPHLGLQLPNFWLIAGYRCPSFHVIGFMLPGIPMVLVGRNPNIAWGGTNMRSASSDLYELSDEMISQLKIRTEKIKVRWWRDKEVFVRTSSLGPVISDAPFFKNIEKPFAMRWVGHQATDEYTAFYRLNRATNWTEFRQAFESYGVSGQNFLYADVQGHIGMVPAVKIPRRQQLQPDDFLLNPKNPRHQWNGLLGTLELPFAYDPPQGFLVSANNRPFVHDPALGYFFSANDRVERLSELLRQCSKVDLDAIKQIQQDVYVPSAIRLRDLLIEKMDRLELIEANNKEFVDQLRQWDGYYHRDSKGPVVFQMLLYHLIRIYYGQKYDADFAEALLGSEHANSFLLHDLKMENDALLKNTLSQALEKANPDAGRFDNWGEMHRLEVSHILGRIPLIGARFRYGNYPTDGSYNSAMKTAHAITNQRHDTFYGANSRFIAMMRDLDENYFVLLGGQDGWLGSDQFADQVPLWLKNDYIQIPFRIETVQKVFPYHLQLTPGKAGNFEPSIR
ncbi:MAG: penicillin acylase family protein [candidate division KSB1 bacterium]|nr:penicillin acylase family protein [candidate division KSB1 bacterium]MDZ7401296.1 penicillin acylase family protein [candidate division KSB1 bacterium]